MESEKNTRMRISTAAFGQSTMESEQQENLLESALKVVKNEAFEMKRALDRNEVMDGLKHAAQMLCELRTSLLTPKFYYRLCELFAILFYHGKSQSFRKTLLQLFIDFQHSFSRYRRY
jgi:hypothetical protein